LPLPPFDFEKLKLDARNDRWFFDDDDDDSDPPDTIYSLNGAYRRWLLSDGTIATGSAANPAIGTNLINNTTVFALPVVAPYVARPNELVEYGGLYWRTLAIGGDPADPNDPPRALLLSERVLTNRRYHNTNVAVTWHDSDLRAWLNGAFYNEIFAGTWYDNHIINAQMVNNDNTMYGTEGGEDSPDQIFLLSEQQFRIYMEIDYALITNDIQNPHNTMSTAYRLSYNETVRGFFSDPLSISPRRLDWFSIEITEPGRLTYSVVPENGAGVTTHWNGVGENLGLDFDFDLEPGTYYLSVAAIPGFTGRYHLTARFSPMNRTENPLYNARTARHIVTGEQSNWWLRSPGQASHRAVTFNFSGSSFVDGRLRNFGDICLGGAMVSNSSLFGVRPAMWVDLFPQYNLPPGSAERVILGYGYFPCPNAP
jgi:hypothetical protein